MAQTPSTAIGSIKQQLGMALELTRRAIDCFDEKTWKSGLSFFEVPVKVACHTLQCLQYYFRDDPAAEYGQVPLRFGKDWWELTDDQQPTQQMVLDFYEDTRSRVMSYLEGLSESDLGRPFPATGTILGNIMYALSHTVHHQGGLNVLAVHHGIDVELWDMDES